MKMIVDGPAQTETEAAERRVFVNLGRLEPALAILRAYEAAARGRIQATIRAGRRRRGWGHV